MRVHENALTPEAALLVPRLSRFKGFYLAGGTALALHIGHRLSVDFDLFSASPLPADQLSRAKTVFKGANMRMTYRSSEQLNLLVNGVKITFFHYEYPVVDPLNRWRGLSIISAREIAAMKAYAIGRRLSYKDYVDWYFLLKKGHVTLRQVIAHANKKFSAEFNDRLFLGQLVSMDDIHDQKIDFLVDPVDRKTIQRFLSTAVRQFKL